MDDKMTELTDLYQHLKGLMDVNKTFNHALTVALNDHLPKALLQLVEEYCYLTKFNCVYSWNGTIYVNKIYLSRNGLMPIKGPCHKIMSEVNLTCDWVCQFANDADVNTGVNASVSDDVNLYIYHSRLIDEETETGGWLKYNTLSQEIKELTCRYWGERDLHQDPNNKNHLFINSQGIHLYDLSTDEFKRVCPGVNFCRSTLMTKRGLYIFNCGSFTKGNVSLFFDCKTSNLYEFDLNIEVEASVSIDVDYLLLLVDELGDIYYYNTLTGQAVKQTWKFHSSGHIRHIINGLAYKDRVLYSIVYTQTNSQVLYYLEQPFETNKWMGPFDIDPAIRIAL